MSIIFITQLYIFIYLMWLPWLWPANESIINLTVVNTSKTEAFSNRWCVFNLKRVTIPILRSKCAECEWHHFIKIHLLLLIIVPHWFCTWDFYWLINQHKCDFRVFSKIVVNGVFDESNINMYFLEYFIAQKDTQFDYSADALSIRSIFFSILFNIMQQLINTG